MKKVRYLCSHVRCPFEVSLASCLSYLNLFRTLDTMKLFNCLALAFTGASCVNGQLYRRNTSVPLYKDPSASIDDRVSDLLSRMTIEEKVSQIVQGDVRNWLNTSDNTYNIT